MAFAETDFLDAFFFDDFLGAAFFLPDFPAAGFAAVFLVVFLLGRLAPADFFATFLLPALFAVFFVVFFRAGLLVAGFRAVAFFFATFRVADFPFVDFPLALLTLRFFPEVFLLTPDLRDARTLVVPARFRFVFADFLAGISTPAGPRKTRNYTSVE